MLIVQWGPFVKKDKLVFPGSFGGMAWTGFRRPDINPNVLRRPDSCGLLNLELSIYAYTLR